MYKFPGSGMGPMVGAAAAPGLAVTGFDYTWWMLLGMILLTAGVFFLRVARRRGRELRLSATEGK